MDWSYIAGFFDGEGSISSHSRNRRNSHQVQISQKFREDQVLHRVAEFLREQGVCCKVNDRRGCPAGYLLVCRHRSVKTFLEKCLPSLIVKRNKAIELLSKMESMQYRRDRITSELLGEAMTLYRQGKSWRQVGEEMGQSGDSLGRAARRYGVPLRSRSDVLRAWHFAKGHVPGGRRMANVYFL
jgi:hypothetical protein